MKDMLGRTITEGDVIMYPDGNNRYGGLYFTVGVVTKLTAKRVQCLVGPLVPKKTDWTSKTTGKTSEKLLVVDGAISASPTVQALLEELKEDGT